MALKKTHPIEDDIQEPVTHLVKNRLPWLFTGLFGGIVTSIIMSHFEKILAADIRLSFFIPVIVYMSDAVGTQTETIYVRHLGKGKKDFLPYLKKELGLGILLGILFGILLGIFGWVWLGSAHIGWTVGLAMCINVIIAPTVAIIIPQLLMKKHTDPALGSGPLATVMQDFLSLMVYFVIATIIIL